MARKQCPITREQFQEHAPILTVTIDGKTYRLRPHDFKTDSFGWRLSDKQDVEIDGVECTVQIGLNITVVGSKLVD